MKKVTLAIALAGTIFLTSGSIIFAGNHIDTKFDFYFTSTIKFTNNFINTITGKI